MLAENPDLREFAGAIGPIVEVARRIRIKPKPGVAAGRAHKAVSYGVSWFNAVKRINDPAVTQITS